MRTVNIKTLFAGKAWLGDKHLVSLENGENVKIIYKGNHMIVTPNDLPAFRSNKSTRSFTDRQTGKPYWLWGIWWKPRDKEGNIIRKKTKLELIEEKQSSLFTN